MRVISDKVAVPLRNPRVSRPRLPRVLGEGLDPCAATIVTGRAGGLVRNPVETSLPPC